MAMSPERIAQPAAARKEENRLNKLISVANYVKVTRVHSCDDWMSVELDCCRIEGPLFHFNLMLERLGYRPVRITSNLLNKAAGRFVIDINTPSYCDPGCEAYHSM